MNISKKMAEDVAKSMTQPMRDNIAKQVNDFKEYVTTIVLGQVPALVQKTFEKHREYFKTCSEVHLTNGNAILNYCSVNCNKVPANNNYNNYQCTNDQFDHVDKLRKDIVELKNEMKQTELSIVSTLMSLRTVKRVIENFPDAAPFMKPYEENKNTDLALPISEISKVLNKYNNKKQ